MDLMARRNLIMGGKNEYIVFEDPIVEQICVSNWSSDGIGLTKADAAAVKNFTRGDSTSVFTQNTQITKFNELVYFTGLNPKITSYPYAYNWFYGCTSLTEITFPLELYSNDVNSNRILNGCTSLVQVNNMPIFNGVWRETFANCWALQSFIIPEGVTTLNQTFYLCKNLTYLDMPSTITTIGAYTFIKNDNAPGWVPYRTVICRATTPPSLNNTADGITTDSNTRIYVPYSADHSILNAYKAAATWSIHASKIYELNQDGTVPS